MSPEPFDSRAKAPPAKRREKGYGDENAPSPRLNLFMVDSYVMVCMEYSKSEHKPLGERLYQETILFFFF